MAWSPPRLLALAALSAAGVFPGGQAFADVPPGPNVKRIDYSFTLKGAPPGSDRVLFAYPCGHSNGAPIVEHQLLSEGTSVTVGRRGGTCAIYAIDRTAYEAWKKEYKPKSGAMQDPALEKLAGDAIKCTGGPTPLFSVDKNDPRSAINQTITVTTLNATTCALSAEPIAPSPVAAGAPSSSSAATSSGEAPTSSSKSRSCTFAPPLAGSGASAGVLAAALAAAVGALSRRRRR